MKNLIILFVLLIASLQINAQQFINGGFEDSTIIAFEDPCTGITNLIPYYYMFESIYPGIRLLDLSNLETPPNSFIGYICLEYDDDVLGSVMDYGIQEGERCISLEGCSFWDNEEIHYLYGGVSLELDTPLTIGATYQIEFLKAKEDPSTWPGAYDENYIDHFAHLPCPFEIGLSENHHSFGELIYTADTATIYGWQSESFTFIASANHKYISIKTIPVFNPDSYRCFLVGLDDFKFTYVSGPEDTGSDDNGSDDNGSDDNGSDDNGTDDNESDGNGSDDNHTDDNHTDNIDGVTNSFVEQNILLHPNPVTNGEVNITVTGLNQNTYEVRLFNQLGQVVYRGQYYSNKIKLDVSELEKGVYFVRVNDSKVHKLVRK